MFSFKTCRVVLERHSLCRTTRSVRQSLYALGFTHTPANLVDMVLNRAESDEYIIQACLSIAQIGE